MVDQGAAVALVDEGERLRHLRHGVMMMMPRCVRPQAERRGVAGIALVTRHLQRLADARAFDDDVIEATAVGQRAHLHGV